MAETTTCHPDVITGSAPTVQHKGDRRIQRRSLKGDSQGYGDELHHNKTMDSGKSGQKRDGSGYCSQAKQAVWCRGEREEAR